MSNLKTASKKAKSSTFSSKGKQKQTQIKTEKSKSQSQKRTKNKKARDAFVRESLDQGFVREKTGRLSGLDGSGLGRDGGMMQVQPSKPPAKLNDTLKSFEMLMN